MKEMVRREGESEGINASDCISDDLFGLIRKYNGEINNENDPYYEETMEFINKTNGGDIIKIDIDTLRRDLHEGLVGGENLFSDDDEINHIFTLTDYVLDAENQLLFYPENSYGIEDLNNLSKHCPKDYKHPFPEFKGEGYGLNSDKRVIELVD